MHRSTERRGAIVLTVSMLLASAGNYGLNSALGRLLPTALFGDAALLVSLVMLSAVVSTALQLGASHTVAGANDLSTIGSLVRRSWIVGGCGAVFLVAAALVVAPMLKVSSLALTILALGWPLHARLAVARGLLQGTGRFERAAATFLGEFALRCVATLVFVATGFGVIGVAIGLNAGFLGGLLVCGRRATSRTPAGAATNAGDRATSKFLLLTGAIAIVSYADVIVAKLVLEPDVAGHYGAVALVGRATAVVALSMQQVVVPLMSRSVGDSSRDRAFAWTVGATAGLATVAFAIASLADEFIVSLAFGQQYVEQAGVLGPYTWATGCFAVVTVVACADLAAGRIRTVGVVVLGAVAQTAALGLASADPASLVSAQVAAMSGLFVAVFVIRADWTALWTAMKRGVSADRGAMGARL